MGRSDRHADDFSDESEITRDHGENAPGGSREGGVRSRRRPGRDREEEDWKVHPRQDSPPEWDEEDRPDA
ncbi:MAG TPA: hypothetical protein VE546_09990 [Streptomyces sp.]|uniref:hypothetical protein n=1 Tax=Streptomyces sp. TaxID=1931 RepID=UPI002D2B24AF|nr:hypothetical protein [Streptomyces sp.]HZG03892.1 hypothetical protein [Streptomyces sp.]